MSRLDKTCCTEIPTHGPCVKRIACLLGQWRLSLSMHNTVQGGSALFLTVCTSWYLPEYADCVFKCCGQRLSCLYHVYTRWRKPNDSREYLYVNVDLNDEYYLVCIVLLISLFLYEQKHGKFPFHTSIATYGIFLFSSCSVSVPCVVDSWAWQKHAKKAVI